MNKKHIALQKHKYISVITVLSIIVFSEYL